MAGWSLGERRASHYKMGMCGFDYVGAQGGIVTCVPSEAWGLVSAACEYALFLPGQDLRRWLIPSAGESQQ